MPENIDDTIKRLESIVDTDVCMYPADVQERADIKAILAAYKEHADRLRSALKALRVIALNRNSGYTDKEVIRDHEILARAVLDADDAAYIATRSEADK